MLQSPKSYKMLPGRFAAAFALAGGGFCWVGAFAPPPACAIVAGNPNPPNTGPGGTSAYPPDSPDNPYNPATQTGRLDTLGLASPFSGVGSIDGGSGTLIDSTHVLTAAHLFGTGTIDPTGINFSLENGAGTTTFAASRVDVDPSFVGVGNDDAYDIAIVTLADPVPSTYKTYTLYTDPLTAGTTLTLVGYGRTGDGVTGYYPATPGRRVGKNNADAFLLPGGNSYSATYAAGDQTYLFDFDSPDETPGLLGGASLGNNVETTIGTGDSGGPGFVQIGGAYQIAAINNFNTQFGTAPYLGPAIPLFGSGGGGAIISAYQGFIASIDPGVVPAPEPNAPIALALGVLGLAGCGVWAGRRRICNASACVAD